MAYLVLTTGNDSEKRYAVDANVTRIGRRDDNEVKLDAPSVSGAHAEIVKLAENFELRDLGSTNGTFVNDERTKSATIYRNDVIRLGNVRLIFTGDDVPPPPVAEGDLSLPRTTVVITPIKPQRLKTDDASEFQKTQHTSRLWLVFLVVILAAIGVAFVMFIRR